MICLDSDCIIDFLNGQKEAVNIIGRYKDELATTEINIFEVFFGIFMNKNNTFKEQELAELFFDAVTIFNADGWGISGAKILSNLIKEGKTIEQNDCLIASIMMANGCSKIITRNIRHFNRINGIEVVSY